VLAKIIELFQAEMRPETNAALSKRQKCLACAALLIEVAVVDNEFDHRELNCLQHVLEEQFSISLADSSEFITLAQNECMESTSMYQFTQLVNQHCTFDDKFDLIVGMWHIAFADGELDKYEEYVIRKVADLIHIAHGDFIRAKNTSRSQL
jgi:uncharacterized tellurite resistance protein B-like protein